MDKQQEVALGVNVVGHMSGNVLLIAVDLSKTGEASKSGKSIVIGTTKGNVGVPGHPGVQLGLNVYRKNEQAAA